MASRYLYSNTYYNQELGLTKTIKADTKWEFDLKLKQLNERWAYQLDLKRKREKSQNMQLLCDKKNIEQQKYIKEYKNILNYTLNVNDKLDWEHQYKKEKYKSWNYNVSEPEMESFYTNNLVPKKSFLEKIFKSLKEKREELELKTKNEYDEKLKQYNEIKLKDKEKYDKNKKEFEKEQEVFNNEIDLWKKYFYEGEKDAVEKYSKIILENSKYPNDFEKNYEIEYSELDKQLIINYIISTPNNISNVDNYKYIKSKNEIKESYMKKTEFEEFYDNIIFQITLRTIHEMFESIPREILEIVIFNGWIEGIDKGTGKEISNCIISLQTSREQFEEINLRKVEVKECIKNLKGVFSGKLILLQGVKPILNINKEDKRFIESKEILDEINLGSNLAEMQWEDFEHLVREIFSKEFSKDGGEVKVTQSSRDGGVDAIAFDTDPIRGRKIYNSSKEI